MHSVHDTHIHRELSTPMASGSTKNDTEAVHKEEVSIDSLAEHVHTRGLSMAAIFFLEMSKPMAGLIQAGCVGIEPLWTMLWGSRGIQQIRWLSEDRKRIEVLIQAIEERFHGS